MRITSAPARAKGVGERKIVMHHCLRNALLPIITVVGVDFGYVLGGSVVIESVFALGGLGTLLISSIRMKDTPVVMGRGHVHYGGIQPG